MQTDNIGFAALQRAFQLRRTTAFLVPGYAIPYQRFADLLVCFATRMQERGVDRRSTVGLVINDPAAAVIAVAAVALLGSKWVDASTETASAFAGTTHVFAAGQRMLKPGMINIDRSWLEAPPSTEKSLQKFPGHAHPDDVWMIARSSGTTGRPKFMPISYEAVWRRTENPELQDGAPPVTCNLFPPTSYVGARINIGNLAFGGTNVTRAPFDELLAKGVNRVMGSPAQIAGAFFSKGATPKGRIRSCKVTGAQVTAQFVETGLRYFEEIHALYGATEAGALTLSRFSDDIPFDGSAGYPCPGAEVEILDGAQMPCAAGVEGIVRVRTPWTVPFYIDEPELTASHFRDGWFYPGDLGVLDGTGALRITGRIGDVINAGGRKLNAAELDEIIQRHPDVRDGYCFIENDEHGADVLSVVVSLHPGASHDGLSSITDAAIQKFGRSKAPQRIYVTDTVPRNENGKPMRTQAATAAASFQRFVPG
jgi:acyl-coenzyme A synthetase/AMP-(fatty) acid ligase